MPKKKESPLTPKPKSSKEINPDQFENLCELQCTPEGIAAYFKVNVETVEGWAKKTYGKSFDDVYKEFAAKGQARLAAIQFELATKNAAMAIFLGKNYLGQRDDAVKDTADTTGGSYHIDSLLLSDNFQSVHRDIMSDKHTEYVFKGGRGSTKSSAISLLGIEYLLNNPDVHWLVVRQVGNTLRDSVYNQIVWAIDQLKLTENFTFRTAPLEITYKKTGQKIMFRGADDPTKIKSIKVPFGHIGLLWFEELDQFRGEEVVRNVEQSAIRGGDKCIIFKSFNPPKTINNWANQYCLIPKESMLVHDSNYLQVPKEWLGKMFMDEADFLKEINPKAYEHEYLGVANGTGGQVFDNVRLEEITEDQIKEFDRIYRGVDWGWFPDPFNYSACYYNPATLTLYIFDEFRATKMSNRETADEIFKRGTTIDDVIICDSSEQKSISDYKSYGLMARAAKKGPNSIQYSMKWMQSLRAIVIDPVRCPNAAKEFTSYEYEQDKDGNTISEYPDKDNHSIDSVRYALEPVWKRRGE